MTQNDEAKLGSAIEYPGRRGDVGAICPLPSVQDEELGLQVRRLVRNKHRMDKVAAEYGTDFLAGDLHGGGYGPAQAFCFFQKTFPFVRNTTTGENRSIALVPTQYTLGCSWRWRNMHLSESEQERLVKLLTDEQALINGSLDKASYFWVRALGLVLPIEGKNRVDFFREQSIESFPAAVEVLDYPAAERMVIFTITYAGASHYWAVLDGRWLQKLEYPNWAIPVLSAYGVKQIAKWPSNYPEITAVRLAFDRPPGASASSAGHLWFLGQPVVDLQNVKAEVDYGNEVVECSLRDIESLSVPPQLWVWSALVVLLCSVTLMFIPEEWAEVSMILAMLVGAGSGSVILMTANLFKAKRRILRRQLLQPQNLAPQRSVRKADSRHGA